MLPQVLLTQPIAAEHLDVLREVCDLAILSADESLDSPGVRARLADCSGLICFLSDRIDVALLARMPALRFVSSVSVGVDHIDVAACTARDVAVGHTPGVLVDTTADLAFALLLSTARRVTEGDRYIRAGQWHDDQPWTPNFFLGKEVSGATLGIIGLGAIGQAVARRAQGFAMRVLGWTPSQRAVRGVESVDLADLLARSDFVSVHLALSDTSRNFLDARKFARMKRGSVLINTARGGIVDESALVDALNSGHLFGAGLDVFAVEPLPTDHPLLLHERVVLAPHIGSATTRTRMKMVMLALTNAQQALVGEPMAHSVNPKVAPKVAPKIQP